MLSLIVVILGLALLPITIGILFSPLIVFTRLNKNHRYDGIKALTQSLGTHVQVAGFILVTFGFILVGLDKSPVWDVGISDAIAELTKREILPRIFLAIPFLFVPFLLFGFLVVLNTLGLSFVMAAWILTMISDRFSTLFITDLCLTPIKSITVNALIGIFGYVLILYGVFLKRDNNVKDPA